MLGLKDRIANIFHHYSPAAVDLRYDYFKNPDDRDFISENGYVVIRNVVDMDSIDVILESYKKLSAHENFYEVDGFITSANYGFDIQKHIHQDLRKVNQDILDKIFFTDKIYHDLLNVLVIKFNKDKKEFYAHQDIPLVDELQASTVFAWIPTTEINDKNGALLVLPKSHKWFRWQRTHDQSESPLKNLRDEILKFMIPIHLNKGDLVLFDNSLVHASLPNFTNDTRIAMNTGIASKNFPLIHYQRINNNNKYIEKYTVDESFWLEGHYGIPDSVPERYHPAVIEKIRYSHYISKSNFIDIVGGN
jgi:ectoine hydroxylase-related dioxygenase (phytanoyl-CoA dioxygenase family)